MGKKGRKDEEFLRMIRTDGREPTARDRWRAFHRLWRIAHGHGACQDVDAGDCFRVLSTDWRLIRLLESPCNDGLVDRSHTPKFLRKRLLDDARKRRLYAGHYEWMDRDKMVANRCRSEHGMEVTPTEVAEVRRKVIQISRAKAAEMDFPVPQDDEDLLKLLKLR